MNKSPEEIISLVDPGNALTVKSNISLINPNFFVYIIFSSRSDYCEVYEHPVCAFKNEKDAKLYAEYLESEWQRKHPEQTNIDLKTYYVVKPLEFLDINEVLFKPETYTDD